MAKIYYNRIKAKIMTIEEVPQRWRAAVQALIDADEATHGEEEYTAITGNIPQ